MTTPKRPRTILAVEEMLRELFLRGAIANKYDAAVSLLADANREIEKLEAENTLLKLQRARRRVGVGR